MRAGLTNLDTLRRYCLAGSLGDERIFDATLVVIGEAVAGMMDRHTNRNLSYLAGAEVVMSADREHIVLPRYPVVSVSKVEVKGAGETSWTERVDEPEALLDGSGIVHFSGRLGGAKDQVRVTWDGGYWFETLEPEEGTTEMPTGATALPGDVRGAFLMQCEQIWQTHDKVANAGGGDNQFLTTRLSTLDLVPVVTEMLRGYVRHVLF